MLMMGTLRIPRGNRVEPEKYPFSKPKGGQGVGQNGYFSAPGGRKYPFCPTLGQPLGFENGYFRAPTSIPRGLRRFPIINTSNYKNNVVVVAVAVAATTTTTTYEIV